MDKPFVLVASEEEFFAEADTYLDRDERAILRQAFELAKKEHGDDRRKSGELFFTHPLTVAYYLAQAQADVVTLTAALLHDVAEDTKISIGEIKERFGQEVAHVVDGVTKFSAVSEGIGGKTLTKTQVQTATLHKLFGMMADDWRVGIIKLFDRLHNLRTIKSTSIESQKRKARETLAVYAPLSNRLGMWELRNEIGQRSVEILHPDQFQEVQERWLQIQKQQDREYAYISRQILERLWLAGVKADVQPSPESLYSIFKQAQKHPYGRHIVDDTLRVVVQVPDVSSCYVALGHVHNMWLPAPQRFDDYIARPRPNLYSALHTTVYHPTGKPIKVRFRTQAMHVLSKYGILARWININMPLWSEELAERVNELLKRISENINLDPEDFGGGVEGVMEVMRHQITLHTPRGDTKQLPEDSTPIDFAYAIHTGVGHRCHAAFVNSVPYPLYKPLSDGDHVFIQKRSNQRPQRVWLDEDLGYAQTRIARANIRRWFRRLKPETAILEARQLLQKELDMLGLPDFDHNVVAQLNDYDNLNLFYHDIGRAEILPTKISTAVLATQWHKMPLRHIISEVHTENGQTLYVRNAGNRHCRLCRTCRPRPGDTILGFIRSDKSITVHQEACPKLPHSHVSDRIITLLWGEKNEAQARILKFQIDVYDRSSLVFEITQLLHNESINIHSIRTLITDTHKSLVIELELINPRQTIRIIHRIHALNNVYHLTCLSCLELTDENDDGDDDEIQTTSPPHPNPTYQPE
ncbi:MAG TPA: RelA/SpoT family protein [Anaerolineae bacterium]|nr:RelA/SpoT family protein [Anaerolineae bacterium]